MEKNEVCLLACVTLLLLIQMASAQSIEKTSEPQEVSSEILVNNTFQYDGKRVVFFGEVVGDVMKRGGNGWVNVHDGTYAIGVYAKAGMLNNTIVSGDYRHKGDMVEVMGVFNRACREHGGDLDIHAESIRVIALGYETERPISMSKVFFTLLVLACNVPLVIVLRRMGNGT